MSRTKLPNRRPSINFKVKVISVAGRDFNVTVTAGVDAQDRIREVFCADFKAGSDNPPTAIWLDEEPPLDLPVAGSAGEEILL
jgi:hypothetical protein